MPTTHVINWKTKSNADKPPLAIDIEPQSIYIGDIITISIYSAYSHELISPYNGLIATKTVAPEPLEMTETLELSGSTGNLKYPISAITSMISALPLVDETTRTIVLGEGQPADGLFSIVNQKLVQNTEELKLHGSITVKYKSFNAQIWKHQGFGKKGKALLFAHNIETGDYENVALTINEKSNSGASIRIEAWASQPKRGFSPYHAVAIYPTTKKLTVKADYGTVKYIGKQEHTIFGEQINFSGKEANANYPVKSFIKLTGVFFDKDGQPVSPSFRGDAGIIKSNVECYGVGFVEYVTESYIYHYDAEITTSPNGVRIVRGHIFAFEKGKFDSAVSYLVPKWNNATKKPIDFYTVSRKLISQEIGTFEYPPNWPTDNIYPGGGLGSTPVVDDPTTVFDKVVEAGYVDSAGVIDFDTYNNFHYEPYQGSEINPDAVYQINTNIPSDIDDTMLLDEMQTAIDEAKIRWGIA